MCMGESLAKMELFLFFVTMVMHFDFECPKGSTLPDLYGMLSMTKIPKPFQVIAKERHPVDNQWGLLPAYLSIHVRGYSYRRAFTTSQQSS